MLYILKNLLNKFSAFFSRSVDRVRLGGFGNALDKILKYKIVILSAIALTILLAITLIQSQTQQTTKQRAGNEGEVSIGVVSAKNFGINETFTTSLTLYNSSSKDISAVNLKILYDPSILELVSFKTSTILIPVMETTDILGIFSYLAINSLEEPINDPVIELGTLTFKGKAPGTSDVFFDGIQITASGTDNLLKNDPAQNTAGKYTVEAAVGTPTPTPADSSSSNQTPSKDCTFDTSVGSLTIQYFNQQRTKWLALITNKCSNVLDYYIWLSAWKTGWQRR